MNMRIIGTAFLLAALFACASGCKGTHPRPANPPSSAVWVDNTFIDCSVESPSKGDRCTVYKDDSGGYWRTVCSFSKPFMRELISLNFNLRPLRME